MIRAALRALDMASSLDRGDWVLDHIERSAVRQMKQEAQRATCAAYSSAGCAGKKANCRCYRQAFEGWLEYYGEFGFDDPYQR